jgi:hypothetical protein
VACVNMQDSVSFYRKILAEYVLKKKAKRSDRFIYGKMFRAGNLARGSSFVLGFFQIETHGDSLGLKSLK